MKIRLITIPNLLTLSNLVCGALAVVSALVYDNLTWAFWLIVAAAAFDFLDGFVARLLGQSSPIGLQLDSLADDISFGLAPSAVLYALYGHMPSIWLPQWAAPAVFVFAAFAALRLAKFNIDETQHAEFCGLPTPAATLFCVSVGVLCEKYDIAIPCEAVVGIAVIFALLMVSNIRMFALKFQGFGWQGNRLRYSFLGASALLIALLGAFAIPTIVLLYVALSIIRNIATR